MQSQCLIIHSEQAIAVADEHRLIPPFDPNADRPEDIYAVQGIIPDAEWNAVSISAMTSAESHRERRALLPYTRSTWLNQHLHQAFSANIPDKATMFVTWQPEELLLILLTYRRLLFCISAMFAFYNARRMVDEKGKLRERLTRIPPALLDGLLSRFTETVRGSTKYVC
jgi:DNA-directed RNA polymerase I subunit RPA49